MNHIAKKRCSLEDWEGKFFNASNYKIFRENVDIYCDDTHQLLCKFRKNVLNDNETQKLLMCKRGCQKGVFPSQCVWF